MALNTADRPQGAAAVRAELASAVRTGSAGASTAGMTTVAQPATLTQARPGPTPAPPQPLTPPPPQPPRASWLPLAIVAFVGLLLVAVIGGAFLIFVRGFAPPPGPVGPGGPRPSAVAAPTPDPREQDATAPAVVVPSVVVPDIAATMAVIQTQTSVDVAGIQATALAAAGVTTPSGPSLGEALLEFGEQGSGDGFLDDPRAVAIGPDGAIYVADYSTRRIQRFSPEGRFERSFFVEDDRPILAMAADRQGRVLVSQNFQVSVFDGASGQLLDTFTDGQGDGFEDIEVLGDGSLIAIPWAGDDLVRLSADGVETGRIVDIMAAADSDSSPQAVAADGLGTLYILADDGAAVYVFAPDGAYRDKFSVADGSPFVELAVDGQGRIYVPGFFGGVQVFEPDGKPVGVIDFAGSVFDLSFDDQNDLYATVNTPRVVKVRP